MSIHVIGYAIITENTIANTDLDQILSECLGHAGVDLFTPYFIWV